MAGNIRLQRRLQRKAQARRQQLSYRTIRSAFLVAALCSATYAWVIFLKGSQPYWWWGASTGDHPDLIKARYASRIPEPPSLWSNPVKGTWKQCVRPSPEYAEEPLYNSTGYLQVFLDGGLNQQRISICNAVAVTRLLNATLLIPHFQINPVWLDNSQFEGIFDIEHFTTSLRRDVLMLRQLPHKYWWSTREFYATGVHHNQFEDIFDIEHFTSSLKRDVLIVRQLPHKYRWSTREFYATGVHHNRIKFAPMHASPDWYLKHVLPKLLRHGVVAIAPFTHRLTFDGLPPDVQRLRCRVNFHALRFVEPVRRLGKLLVERLRDPHRRHVRRGVMFEKGGDVSSYGAKKQEGVIVGVDLEAERGGGELEGEVKGEAERGGGDESEAEVSGGEGGEGGAGGDRGVGGEGGERGEGGEGGEHLAEQLGEREGREKESEGGAGNSRGQGVQSTDRREEGPDASDAASAAAAAAAASPVASATAAASGGDSSTVQEKIVSSSAHVPQGIAAGTGRQGIAGDERQQGRSNHIETVEEDEGGGEVSSRGHVPQGVAARTGLKGVADDERRQEGGERQGSSATAHIETVEEDEGGGEVSSRAHVPQGVAGGKVPDEVAGGEKQQGLAGDKEQQGSTAHIETVEEDEGGGGGGVSSGTHVPQGVAAGTGPQVVAGDKEQQGSTAHIETVEEDEGGDEEGEDEDEDGEEGGIGKRRLLQAGDMGVGEGGGGGMGVGEPIGGNGAQGRGERSWADAGIGEEDSDEGSEGAFWNADGVIDEAAKEEVLRLRKRSEGREGSEGSEGVFWSEDGVIDEEAKERVRKGLQRGRGGLVEGKRGGPVKGGGGGLGKDGGGRVVVEERMVMKGVRVQPLGVAGEGMVTGKDGNATGNGGNATGVQGNVMGTGGNVTGNVGNVTAGVSSEEGVVLSELGEPVDGLSEAEESLAGESGVEESAGGESAGGESAGGDRPGSRESSKGPNRSAKRGGVAGSGGSRGSRSAEGKLSSESRREGPWGRKGKVAKEKRFVALHLRFDMDMVAHSACDYGETWAEREALSRYREYAWMGRVDKLRFSSQELRQAGKCPLTPEEVGLVLAALGFSSKTRLYVATYQVYGGEKRIAPLRRLFPWLEDKTSLATQEELKPFLGKASLLAALDFYVSRYSDVFVSASLGNMHNVMAAHRAYFGGLKTINFNGTLLAMLLAAPKGTLKWIDFVRAVRIGHRSRMGKIKPRRPGQSIYTYPAPDCLCPVDLPALSALPPPLSGDTVPSNAIGGSQGATDALTAAGGGLKSTLTSMASDDGYTNRGVLDARGDVDSGMGVRVGGVVTGRDGNGNEEYNVVDRRQ